MPAQRNRITARIDDSKRVTLPGHMNPRAVPANDRGEVDPALVLPYVTITFQASAAQQADLNQFLAQQQNPSSPNYHHWLTPEQYADRFGISQADLTQVTAWLQSHNLTVVGTARGRNWIAVRGTAASVASAFGTRIHHYQVNGELHYANATEPTVPAVLQGMVAHVRGLTDFRLKPRSHPRGVASGAPQPSYTNAGLCGDHCLGADDLATIYNITPLYQSNINGSGQKLAVVGQTQIRLADIEAFRSFFGLPQNDPQVLLVPGSQDPGIQSGDLSESELDLEISGAVARNATIIFVYSGDVLTSAQYAIDQNVAPVLSISYGDCERAYQASDAASLEAIAAQANAQGITWFAASGDAGATDCYGDGLPGASSFVSVDLPASLPEVTGVGGNEFNEGSGNYWNATNSATNASATGYIPETAWNDTATDGSPSASGGGASTFFSKPSWQIGAGVPNDNVRDVPDIAVSSSADHDGYLIITSDPSFCNSGRRGTAQCQGVVGGTSVGAPFFAGLFTLFNQSLGSQGLGNINPMLYSLAQSSPAAYHDVTSGNNIITVVCPPRQGDCTPGPVGFNAGPGYDQVTGLGSVDAQALLTAWGSGGAAAAPSITGLSNSASYTQAFAPGMIVTIFGTGLAPSVQSSVTTPLPREVGGVTVTINGIAAPLLYISPGQLNVQIPNETPANTNVTLIVSNNGRSASTSFPTAAAAPGIFTDANGAPVPSGSGSRSSGQSLTLYITGYGATSLADGTGPAAGTASLPSALTMTIGGVTVPSSMMAVAIPQGYVGVAQVNYQIPSTVPVGAAPVVVTVGGASSKAAMLTVTP